MNETENRYFNELRGIQLRLSASLQDPRLSGVNEVISNLYRDEAHFVYELLQNADDQGATHAKFLLTRHELVFIHNAPRHFSISNPQTHAEDKEAGRLGNVNSILSIASSSKTGRHDEVPIGKFGLGFKSVFVYTDRPEIYDDNIRFSISHFIVPDLLSCDHPLRKRQETLFRFPFKAGKAEAAYREIGQKLANLGHPLLFLNHLNFMEWETEDNAGYYRLDDQGAIGSGRKLRYRVGTEDEARETELWKFSRPDSGHDALAPAVVFEVEQDAIVLKRHPLYCYLPTAGESHLPVILHAPFKLTGNRESIMAHDSHNLRMIDELASLLAASLQEICRLGEEAHKPWISDNLTEFLPPADDATPDPTDDAINLAPLTQRVLEAVREGAMLWCADLERYLPTASAFVADNGYLAEVYPSRLLSHIYNKECGWVLPSLTAEIKRGALLPKMLGIERLSPEKILRKISPDLLAQQPEEWLKAWYVSLRKVPNLWEKGDDTFLRYKKIILTADNTFEAPFVKGDVASHVHLPGAEGGNLQTGGLCMVKPSLVEDANVRNFFRNLGLTEVNDFILAEQVLLPVVLSAEREFKERLDALVNFVRVFLDKLIPEQQAALKPRCLLPAWSTAKGWEMAECAGVKLHNADNDLFFRDNPEAKFVDFARLKELLPADDVALLQKFTAHFPELQSPTLRLCQLPITDKQVGRIPAGAQRPAPYNQGKAAFEYIEEPVIDGFELFVTRTAPCCPAEAAELLERLSGKGFLQASYRSSYWGTWHSAQLPSLHRELLCAQPWLEAAGPALRKMLGLPVRELQPEDMEVLQSVFSSSGIVSKEDVENLLQYMEQHGVLERFQLKQRIEEQKAVVKSSKPCSLAWLEEVLDLRLKYVEAGEKKDIEFLVRSLLQAIGTLEVERDRDLRELLPDGIHLLFGPPGTGKTTEITRMVQSLTEPHPSGRILILTPTNAAAGVLAERLKHQHIRAYRGVNVANSELVNELEDLQIPIYDADNDSLPLVLVSTVHYYARTFALKEQDYLHNLAWDAIFIDEASMVTLDYVLLALFKGRQCNAHCEFHIVGDPLQLPAITNLDPFILEDARLDEFNFYSFIGLSEFSETPEGLCPQLKGKLGIRLLRKQYRSVPPLCEMMSRFAYQGMVQPAFQGPPLGLPAEGCSVWGRPLTFLRFPVTKAEGSALSGRLTDLDKLKGSNFHIYSALLVKEMLQHLFARLEKADFSRELSIGIITPYTAQKKLLEKLMNVGTFRHKANVGLCVNTIHQFQGDEFDIVMLVLNPPNLQMVPPDNILINQRNLINVAISRAKHCLVVLYPDASCEVKNFLHIHKHSPARNIESLAEEIFHCNISELTVQADDVERELFGRTGFLAETSEVLLHEEVNYHEAAHPCTYRFVKGMGTIDILHNENPLPEVLIL